MNMGERISRLELLLTRIRERRRMRRAAGPAAPEPAQDARLGVAPAAPNILPSRESVGGILELVEDGPSEALSEDDVLEMSSELLESVPPFGDVRSVPSASRSAEEPVEFSLSDDAPDSSERDRAPDIESFPVEEPSLIEEGREVPVKTPPPESGQQQAPLTAAFSDPEAAGFKEDRESPSFSGVARTDGPSVEQLGQTIDLSPAEGPDLELDRLSDLAPPAPAVEEELEAALPGAYTAQYPERDSGGPVQELSEGGAEAQESGDTARWPPTEPRTGQASRVVARSPVFDREVAEFSKIGPSWPTRTFLSLLDESLGARER